MTKLTVEMEIGSSTDQKRIKSERSDHTNEDIFREQHRNLDRTD